MSALVCIRFIVNDHGNLFVALPARPRTWYGDAWKFSNPDLKTLFASVEDVITRVSWSHMEINVVQRWGQDELGRRYVMDKNERVALKSPKMALTLGSVNKNMSA